MISQGNKYDLIVIGSGAAGMMAAITAAREGKSVLLLEKLSKIGAKLKATGGGRCNLTNTLDNETFMGRFGRNGRFMTPALEALDHKALMAFFREIGVESHAPDGYRVFPVTHSSSTIIDAMEAEMARLGVEVRCSQKVVSLLHDANRVSGVETETDTLYADNVITATGGKGYPVLGAEGDGYTLAESVGHKVTEIFPAMMPLKTKEKWVANCTADTIAKVTMTVDMKKYKKLKAQGDLIFTKSGIRGPVVLDFSREITPLLSKYDEVPVLMNLTKGMNEEQIRSHFKKELAKNPHRNTLELLTTLLPESVSRELCGLAGADPELGFSKQSGQVRDGLVKLLVWTPLTINGHDGFKMAMITRGGVSLKEIDPDTMQSRRMEGLYFCGEVMDLDGPCGGYNLQWSFASGYLAGKLKGSLSLTKKVLVLCTGNSCRSIIAEALINKELEGVEAYSSGVAPSGRVNPNAKKVLEAHDVWDDAYHSKTLDEVMEHDFDLVVTVCDHARETCPMFPKPVPRIHVGFEDPDGKGYEAFEETYEEIRTILLPRLKEIFKKNNGENKMKKNVFKTAEGAKIAFTGAVAKQKIVTMVENCSTGNCECMSDETKKKISNMEVVGEDGNVELKLTGDVSKEELEEALKRSKVLNEK